MVSSSTPAARGFPLPDGKLGPTQRECTWLVASLSLPIVAFVTWLDATCFFELGYFLRWLATGLYLVLVGAFLRGVTSRAIAGGSVIWMLVVLPHVRWDNAKAFYVDARRLELGMTAAEAREIMARHLELGVDYHPTAEERGWLPEAPDPEEGMIFLHCAMDWTDHCEVRLDPQGRVRDIHIEKD